MQKSRFSIAAILSFLAPLGAAIAAPYTFTTITVPPPSAGAVTRVTGINDVGQIVGSVGQNSNAIAFIENIATGAITTFSGVGIFGTTGDAIDNQGQVVGSGLKSGGTFGYLRDPVSGAYTLLPAIGPFGTGSNTTGINDAGQVVGNFLQGGRGTPSGSESVLYDLTTGTSLIFSDPATAATTVVNGVTLTFPGYTSASDINNRGQIVGSISTDVVDQTGFLLDLATNTYTVLAVPGSTTTTALGINDNGQVVGSYQIGTTTNAFLLDLATGLYQTLTDPAGTSTVAYGINDAGQIVGTFIDASGTQTGFLATPTATAAIPEPATLTLLAGLIGAVALARRKLARTARKTSVST